MPATRKMSGALPRGQRTDAHTDAALLASEQRFRSLSELSHDWYWEQDAELRFTFVSEGFFQRSSIRREDILGKGRWEFAVGSPLASSWEEHRAVLEAHLPFRDFEFERFEVNGAKHYQSASGDPVFDASGRFTGYRGTGRDVTERVLAEQKLREQRRLLARAQELAGLGYWEYESSTGTVKGSRELRRMLDIEDGLPAQTLEWGFSFLHRDDRERVRALLEQSIAEGREFRFEARTMAVKGSERTVVVSGEGVRDAIGRVCKVIGSCFDITERRRHEAELRDAADRLQALSRRLVEAQETERRRIAAELHDQVGQNLTALSINLDILARRVNAFDGEAMRRLQDSMSLLEVTARKVEGVLDELRPSMLDDWGIGPTLQWLAEDFSRRTEIPARVSVLGAERRIDAQSELALVRVAQEALNNVAKHSRARVAEVVLRWEATSVHLEIADDGFGFEHKDSSSRRGLGLVSMRERMLAAQGLLEIESAPGKGTRVRASVWAEPCRSGS